MRKLFSYFPIMMIGALSYYAPIAKASNDTTNVSQVGRYTTVANEASPSQSDLLSQVIQIRFPQNIQTVGEAMEYLLRFSGYSLVSTNHMSAALKTLLSKPLPVVDRELGPLSLRKSLITLTGNVFRLTQDPINRTVDFQLKPDVARLVSKDRYSSIEQRG